MKTILLGIMFLTSAVTLVKSSWALDEGVLTPTKGTSVSQEDTEFQKAMGVWYKHDYVNGEKALRKFAKVSC